MRAPRVMRSWVRRALGLSLSPLRVYRPDNLHPTSSLGLFSRQPWSRRAALNESMGRVSDRGQHIVNAVVKPLMQPETNYVILMLLDTTVLEAYD